AVDLKIAEDLRGLARRPCDPESDATQGTSQSDRGRERVATETGSAGDDPVSAKQRNVVAIAAVVVHLDVDASAQGRPVGRHADELHIEPVLPVTGVLKKEHAGLVARRGASRFEKDIDVAVAVPVGEGDAVALLEVPGARGRGDVLEPLAAHVLE